LEDRRNVGENSFNSGDGTDQRVQSLKFMMMIITGFPVLSLGWSDLCDKYLNFPRRFSGRDKAVGVVNRYKLVILGSKLGGFTICYARPERSFFFFFLL
jgi:hypothetical protein